ncbi:uncharacterized protein [Coffea arabica]|uniref:Uncharacterized protein isoform X2 n=1 Tax=Coffea arabica TaxID=13443 RepID=A0A6P6XER5_COFAR|nr:DNA annealing helicase and endonuclease ZRANB3-like isoform X2 [Coffea arabica]
MDESGEEEITEAQKQRAESNRRAALAKRKAAALAATSTTSSTVAAVTTTNYNSNANQFQSAWKLFKCQKLSSSGRKCSDFRKPLISPPSTEKFRARLEICSPDSFFITPFTVPGFPYPGDEACFEKLSDWLSNVVPPHYTQNNEGGRACKYSLGEYESILKLLKNCEGVECEEIPWGTFNVIETMLHSYSAGKWIPHRPEFLTDEKVNELIRNLPKKLLDALLPFQVEGVQFGLRRGGRCLIADEMGLGKTLQAIAIAGCFSNEGPILIVCPAILRYSWAEELERWLPFCLPSDIHLVFCHQDNPTRLAKCPKVVVISYKMLHHLWRSMLQQEWATLIVDESHHLRCTKKRSEPEEIKSVLDVAMKVRHLILLSGTPSLSRPFDIFHQINMLWPGLLGETKYDFAKTYCSVKLVNGCQGKVFQDFSKGIRLEELNVLLRQTVMIRRLKQHVLAQLPPIRRKIMRLVLRRTDIASAMAALGLVLAKSDFTSFVAALGVLDSDTSADDTEDKLSELSQDKSNIRDMMKKEDQILGLAKLSGFLEWLSIHPMLSGFDGEEVTEASFSSQKMIIFAHHHIVCDRIQEFLLEKGVEYIRIDAHVSSIDRKEAVQSFQTSKQVKIAIIGILAGGIGLTLTAANNVVFLELPKEISNLNQAESRAHRIGQTKAVNIYIFCAKGTSDESRWQKLNKSLFEVSAVMNGKHAAIPEIKVEMISNIETTGITDKRNGDPVIQREGDNVVSAKNVMIPQIYCHIPGSWPSDQYCESYKVANRGSSGENGIGIVSSEVVSLPSEASPTLGCNAFSVAISETAGTISSHNLDDSEATQKNEKVHPQSEVELNSNASEPIEAASTSSVQVEYLRFEVSQYTGRIHLYSCIPGMDSRPRPLFLSFRPEELESEDLHEDVMIQGKNCIQDDHRYRSAVLMFMKQWNQLRPIERRKLLVKPLQLPLSTELCYLMESLNHDKGGLLKCGSTRRITPLDEITSRLPSDAVLRKVHLCIGGTKKEKVYTQGWSTEDKPLCKFCQSPCMNENAKRPEYFEDLFCNLECYVEYSSRTKTKYLRQALFQVERGICTMCQLDCHGLVEKIKPLSHENRQQYIRVAAPKLAKCKKLFDKLIQDPTEGNAWHADHLVPVYQGGGECRLENMRTLCIACHADVTAAQCSERRITRADAKRELEAAMKKLDGPQMHDAIDSNLEKHQQVEAWDGIEEKELLVEVPGSAYSGAKANSSIENQEQENPQVKA